MNTKLLNSRKLINASKQLMGCQVRFCGKEDQVKFQNNIIDSDFVINLAGNESVAFYRFKNKKHGLMVIQNGVDSLKFHKAIELNFDESMKMLGEHGQKFILDGEYGCMPMMDLNGIDSELVNEEYIRVEDTVLGVIESFSFQSRAKIGWNVIDGDEGHKMRVMINENGGLKVYLTKQIPESEVSISDTPELELEIN